MSLVGRRGQLRWTPPIAPLHLQKAPLLAQTRHLCLTRERTAVDDLWEALPQPRCNVPNFCVSGRRPGLTQRAARRPGKVIEATAGWVDGTWEPSRRLKTDFYISRAMVPTGALGEGRWKSSLRDLQRTRNFLSRLRLPHACDGGKAY